jgi:UDP-2,3-diacylglucosamine hydrolase
MPKLLNSIALSGSVWIASDIHLGPATPLTTRAFLGFLQKAAASASSLLLPGDIFDVWIGDDIIHDAPPWLVPVLAGLKSCAQSVSVWLGHGNRDFLMGEELANEIAAQLLPEVALLDTDHGAILLTHGDKLCTDDKPYQAFRSIVRNPAWQAEFLSKSMPERQALAQQMRQTSMLTTQTKAADIMDVNPEAVAALFRETGVTTLVHGHTHRPHHHVLENGGEQYERWVLPDWDCDHAQPGRGGWLVIDEGGLLRVDLGTATATVRH